jgi:nucleotide sugar dehydrogenase
VNFDALDKSLTSVGRVLQKGNLVILRSTVPVGTTRKRCLPKLEEISGLKGGYDFHLVFAPERTIEGNALKELKTLPQIVGGLTPDCVQFASGLFQIITPSIVRVENLEAAEIIKLVNNTFRDTVFAFANDVAQLCHEQNLNAFEVISAANEGYPRNPIPLPSPGVGGICLFKDPILYQVSKTYEGGFGKVSRDVNSRMVPTVVDDFIQFTQKNKIQNKKVFIIGLAFKGMPETSDIRLSPSLDLFELLKNKGFDVHGFDFVVSSEDTNNAGIKHAKIGTDFNDYAGVFVMNNNSEHRKLNINSFLKKQTTPLFFFDGWFLFDKQEIESHSMICYSTLGYQTKNG